MIYIYSGNDNKNKISSIKKKFSKNEIFFLSPSESTKETIFDYTASLNLFGIPKTIVVENFLTINNLSVDELFMLQKSDTPFIFLEDKFLVADEKKYKKYTEAIEKFEVKEVKPAPAYNVFSITDAFASRDKIGAWSLYINAIEKDSQPEAISGILFWKIKTLIMTGSKNFAKENLKQMSSSLVDIYHRSHMGEMDMKIGLEQFILKSLS
jgi:DNA polymerase III delta subunit